MTHVAFRKASHLWTSHDTRIRIRIRTCSMESGDSRLQTPGWRERDCCSGCLGCSRREGVMRLPLEGSPKMPNACSAAASSSTRVPAATSDSVRS